MEYNVFKQFLLLAQNKPRNAYLALKDDEKEGAEREEEKEA